MNDRSNMVVAWSLSIILYAPALSGSSDKAKEYYERALAENEPARKVEWLEKSLSEAETFQAHYVLGDALLEIKDYVEAKDHFHSALRMAPDDRARARACFKIGRTLEKVGEDIEAFSWFKESVGYHPYANVQEHLRNIELQQMRKLMGSDEIAARLKASKSFGPKPRLDLRIQFDFDSASLNASGRRQADELRKALLEHFEGSRFALVGHTDKQGDEEYNMDLSWRRAETVKQYLIRHLNISAGLFEAVGKGETELLYLGDSEDVHALNRRVEVIIGSVR